MMYIFLTESLTIYKGFQLLLKDSLWPREIRSYKKRVEQGLFQLLRQNIEGPLETKTKYKALKGAA